MDLHSDLKGVQIWNCNHCWNQYFTGFGPVSDSLALPPADASLRAEVRSCPPKPGPGPSPPGPSPPGPSPPGPSPPAHLHHLPAAKLVLLCILSTRVRPTETRLQAARSHGTTIGAQAGQRSKAWNTSRKSGAPQVSTVAATSRIPGQFSRSMNRIWIIPKVVLR